MVGLYLNWGPLSSILGVGFIAGHRVPTKGTSGVGLEPHVDTVNMKPMIAFREHSSLLALGQLAQADGALQSIFLGLEDDHRKRSEDGRVEAEAGSCGGAGCRLLAGCEDESAAAEAAGAGGGGGTLLAAPPEIFGVEVEEEDEDDDHEEDDDAGNHDLPCQPHRLRIV